MFEQCALLHFSVQHKKSLMVSLNILLLHPTQHRPCFVDLKLRRSALHEATRLLPKSVLTHLSLLSYTTYFVCVTVCQSHLHCRCGYMFSVDLWSVVSLICMIVSMQKLGFRDPYLVFYIINDFCHQSFCSGMQNQLNNTEKCNF